MVVMVVSVANPYPSTSETLQLYCSFTELSPFTSLALC